MTLPLNFVGNFNKKFNFSNKKFTREETEKIKQSDLFWLLWKQLNYKLPMDTSLCYQFVLTSSFHRHVVAKQPSITFHYAFNLSTFCEVDCIEISVIF